MSIPVRVTEELYEQLRVHAEADGRSIIKELETILSFYFDEEQSVPPRGQVSLPPKNDIQAVKGLAQLPGAPTRLDAPTRLGDELCPHGRPRGNCTNMCNRMKL